MPVFLFGNIFSCAHVNMFRCLLLGHFQRFNERFIVYFYAPAPAASLGRITLAHFIKLLFILPTQTRSGPVGLS